MSGVVAIVSRQPAPVVATWLRQMIEAMAARGPDRHDTVILDLSIDGPRVVGLGCALLRSTPESAHERQPMSLADRVWISADARVDGRAELIAGLRGAGRAVRDDAPDTELLLHAYDTWGDACVQRLLGDFAFVVWDGARQRLFCARDQLGVTPLYYAVVDGGLLVSNTVDCLRLHPEVSDRLNDQFVADELIFGTNQEHDTTLFADIRCVPPAHTLTWSATGFVLARYWELPEPADYLRYRRDDEYLERFRDLFDQAVADRLRTERAGIMMSGGLDSTNVAAAAVARRAATGSPAELRAYTAVYGSVIKEDEGRYAALTAAGLDLPVEYVVADAAMGSDPRQRAQGEQRPFFRRVATGVRVLLTGQGGDAAVYPDERYWMHLIGRLDLGHLIHDVRAHRRQRGRYPPLFLRATLRRMLGRPLWRPPYPDWLRPDFAARLLLRERLEWITDERLSDRTRRGLTAPFWSSVVAARDPGLSGIPLKVRHPFFDLRLLQYLLEVPPVPWFIDKHLLRAAWQGVLPDEVRLRRKTPLPGWPAHAFAEQFGVPPWMDEIATGPALAPYVDPARLLHSLQSPRTQRDFEYQSAIRAIHLGVRLSRLAAA